MKYKNISSLTFSVIVSLITVSAYCAGYPHSPDHGVNCDDCHGTHGVAIFGGNYLLPDWTPTTIDDTQANSLCWSCHNDVIAHHVETHSSLQADNGYGDWTIDCVVCHDPHTQYQLTKYNPDSYLFTATAVSMTASTILFPSDPGWTVGEFVGYFVVPNILEKNYSYEIIANTNDTLTVDPTYPMDLAVVDVGQPSAVVYGKLIRDQIDLARIVGSDDAANKTGARETKFYNTTGDNSFSDDPFETINGVCEVCHTMTNHFRNDGVSGSDWQHTNMGSPARTNCLPCHSHENGFAHGGQCGKCHGHDGGGDDVDFGLVPTGGKGSYVSHSTHTEMDSDDQRGPQLSCWYCHAGTVPDPADTIEDADFSQFYAFKTGTDSNSDGTITFDETDVCNECHSPNGTYDGVNDPDLGAKYGNNGELGYNWKNRVYSDLDNKTLKPGLEKWCATCHDEDPSIVYEVAAPNVIGDEDGAYTYGTGWGYYKTGHGLGAGEQFPSKGDVETLSGRPVECDSCHDYATAHVDGVARTFADNDEFGLDPAIYRQGYRLKLIDAQEPYQMPRPSNIGNNSDQYRVCFQGGCHVSEPFTPFTDLTDMNTNLVTDGKNRHAYHLNFNNQEMAAADWSGAYNSRMTCVVCHNVHGSTQLAMVRDGKLIGREPGQQIWYKNDAVTYIDVNTYNPPEPDDVPLSASDGTAWIGASASNLCANCHSTWPIRTEDRTPFQDVAKAPFLEWVGTNDLISDGVAPDSGVGQSTFTFRISYSDGNNDSPSPIEVWVDLDDNGSYDAGEKYAMAETDITDTTIFNGKNYTNEAAHEKRPI